MSFEYAPVTKVLMMGIALTSVTAGIFDVKHYLHLQLVPHISKYHQYWRLGTHHFACANSSDLFLVELVLYNVAIHIERSFGSVKFASFLSITVVINTLFEFLSMLALRPFSHAAPQFNYIPAGPTALVFTVLYQYLRVIPHAYEFKIFGVSLSDKIWVYALASQLAISYLPATLLPVLVGFFTGYMYRSDFLQLKGWRIPHKLVRFAQHWVQPLLGEDRPARRTNRVIPQRRTIATLLDEEEVITTARPSTNQTEPGQVRQEAEPAPAPTTPSETSSPGENTPPGGMVRQWMSELTGAARPAAAGGGTVRVPSDSEVNTLTAMFPDISRDAILGVLQRSSSIEAAAETLLSSQSHA